MNASTASHGHLVRLTLSVTAFDAVAGEYLWWTHATAFVFECPMFDFHFSTWGYRIEPTATGCRVTEWSEDLRPESALEFSQQMCGVDDRAERDRQTISGTLERLAAALEVYRRPLCLRHVSSRRPDDP